MLKKININRIVEFVLTRKKHAIFLNVQYLKNVHFFETLHIFFKLHVFFSRVDDALIKNYLIF